MGEKKGNWGSLTLALQNEDLRTLDDMLKHGCDLTIVSPDEEKECIVHFGKWPLLLSFSLY